jgi:hypothetical protein
MAGKSFTRYYRDAAFRAAVDEQFSGADAATEPGVWITYAVHDPTRIDHIGGEADGLIIYVGQSKEFRKRIRKRMRDAGTATRRPTDRIDGACYDITSKGPPPRFTVLERTRSAIDSLISETNHAKRLLAAGYPLLNQWTEQKFGGIVDRHTIPHAWLWPMTASDATGSNIDVIVRDKASGGEVVIDLSTFPASTRLREIKASLVADMTARNIQAQVRLHVR